VGLDDAFLEIHRDPARQDEVEENLGHLIR